MANLFDNRLPPQTREQVEILHTSAVVRIERIVSWGQASPADFWYDQAEDEWVSVLAGRAQLKLRDPIEVMDLQAGDCLLIPAHRRHRVEWTQPDAATIWLAVFSPPSSAG